jgi:hypothetical protein
MTGRQGAVRLPALCEDVLQQQTTAHVGTATAVDW